jgi:pimeloyl-ACP methyl ester carboxylesterase
MIPSVTLLARTQRPSLATACTPPAPGRSTIVFLPGYASDMGGSKAVAIAEWAAAHGVGCIRFDYAGCGASDGDFADETLETWRDDALSVIAAHADPVSPLILVGSSMGGWLMLLVALALGSPVAGLIGIAAAPDFTEWDFDEAKRAILARDSRLLESNPYGPEPTLYTRALWESGQHNLVLGDTIAIDCPVTLLQGQVDPDVPWSLSLTLAERLRSAEVRTVLVKDGNHRLSRDQDIALLLREVAAMVEQLRMKIAQ